MCLFNKLHPRKLVYVVLMIVNEVLGSVYTN